MKELNEAIYNNYKSFNELIERLESVKDAIKKQNYGIAMDILCKPYPEFQITTSTELKESDDRIRKALIDEYEDKLDRCACESFNKGYKAAIEHQKEKQGEQKCVIDEGKSEIDYCFTKMMNGEKVSTTWSEEDDVMIRDILRCLPAKSRPEYNQRRADWLKSLKERIRKV